FAKSDLTGKELANGKYADRVIVITDGQDTGHGINAPANALLLGNKNYIINVASYKNGIGYGPWIEIDGFSESVVRYITE
ncbi:hypothetical protein LAJ57_13915, partial [Streptococcus pneumoniae]|uniref:hypothetical protein n=1 Tax=Streptococcus pneumoniae TaxID=1313 RepID=UPI001CC04EFD